VVLFPDMRLLLHIFEPRYKQMIRYCVDSEVEFGVTLAKQDGLAAVGCTAATLHILRTYPDGQMDIETRGNLRYHLRRVYRERAYFEADVEYLTDAKSAVSEELDKELTEACDRCYELLQTVPPGSPPPGQSLAFYLAAGLPMPLDYKQELLEFDSEPERRRSLLDNLNQWIPRLEQTGRMQQKARGNGHALH
jgi:Lon protease-like protein